MVSKYVSFEMYNTAIIFPDTLKHSDVAAVMRNLVGEPRGAGFVNVRDDEVFPYGRSVSLHLGPHQDDQLALKRALGLTFE